MAVVSHHMIRDWRTAKMLTSVVVIGALVAVGFIFAAKWLFPSGTPDGLWWKVIFGIPVLVGLWLMIEGLGLGIHVAVGAEERNAPKWKRVLAMVLSVMALIAVLVFLKWLQ